MELRKQCRFCTHFDVEYDVELVFFTCRMRRFLRAEDKDCPDLAPTCAEFVLDDRPGSRWSRLSHDYKDSLK